MKHALFLTLLAATLALAGCSRPTPKGDTNAPAASSNDGRPSVSAFVSVNMDRVSLNDFVDSVSTLYPHRVVIYATNSKPGAAYQVSAELFDASGKSVLKKTQGYKAPESDWYMVFDYQIPEKLPKAGEWKWKVAVAGIGTAEKNFEMLPPSEAQQQDQARHQKAREAVLLAFANTWVHSEDFGVPCFFTSLLTGRKNSAGQPESSGILEVAGITGDFSKRQPTTAEAFNGITYIGRAVFAFQIFRFWKEGEWEDWQDVDGQGNAFMQTLSALRTDFRRILPQGMPREATNFLEALQLGGFELVFDILQRDGHWYITSNSGAVWIDQVQTQQPTQPKNAAPRYGFIETQKKEADSPRRVKLKETQEMLKKFKAGAPQDRPDILKTMKAVRDTGL